MRAPSPVETTFTQSDKAILLPQDADFATAVDRWLSGEIASGAMTRRLERALGN